MRLRPRQFARKHPWAVAFAVVLLLAVGLVALGAGSLTMIRTTPATVQHGQLLTFVVPGEQDPWGATVTFEGRATSKGPTVRDDTRGVSTLVKNVDAANRGTLLPAESAYSSVSVFSSAGIAVPTIPSGATFESIEYKVRARTTASDCPDGCLIRLVVCNGSATSPGYRCAPPDRINHGYSTQVYPLSTSATWYTFSTTDPSALGRNIFLHARALSTTSSGAGLTFDAITIHVHWRGADTQNPEFGAARFTGTVPDGTNKTVPLPGLKLGTNTFPVKAAGSGVYALSVAFQVGVKPEVVGISPALNGTITVDATDANIPHGDSITGVEWNLVLDHVAVSSGEQEGLVIPFEVLRGQYKVDVRVKDAQGTWSEWASRTFFVDDPGSKLTEGEFKPGGPSQGLGDGFRRIGFGVVRAVNVLTGRGLTLEPPPWFPAFLVRVIYGGA